jgi:uncharacterized membrane protein
MIPYLLDWAALFLRWLHVIAGIAWIGASFYFVWLDNHLRPPIFPETTDPGIGGEVWAVHGGGFYRAQKYRSAPAALPPTLHWFYWEAYTTWLSGFALLCLLYFWRADAYLVDPAVMPLSKGAAVACGLAVLVASWLVYDVLCRSPFARNPGGLAAVLAASIAAEAWALCRVFSGRGAFMLFGAALGTIMVANVLFVIIPGQRGMVSAKRDGRPLDPAPGLRGKQRSVHNTYFTLPVLFVMISNHYAMTYGAAYNWLVLIAMSFAGASIRAWFVARHKPAERGAVALALPGVLGLATLAAVVAALAPASGGSGALSARAGSGTRTAAGAGEPGGAAPAVALDRVQSILAERCVPCHAKNPTEPGFAAAPNGLMFESIAEVRAHLPEIQQQLATRSMPLGNLTAMTDEERAAVLMWIGHGAGG